MRDKDVRSALHKLLLAWHGDESPLIMNEVEICAGNVRADIAVFNGSISGFEIKSQSDTIDRLPRQVAAYNRVFEYATLVSDASHIDSAMSILPSWWGVLVALDGEAGVEFAVERLSERNPALDIASVTLMLWRDEAMSLLEAFGLDNGMRSKPTRDLVVRLVEKLPVHTLVERVRLKIKARGDWQSAARRKRDGAPSQPPPRQSHSRYTFLPRSRQYSDRPS